MPARVGARAQLIQHPDSAFDVDAGVGGGMAGGMPMGGQGGQGQGAGMGKPVQSEDEALYTEDRTWTEGVIGRRRAS